MRYAYYSEQEKSKYKIVFLVNQISKDEIYKAYLEPFNIDPNDVLLLTLHQEPGNKKTPVKIITKYIEEELKNVLDTIGAEHVVCTNGDYFKKLTNEKKTEVNLGYVLDSQFGDWKVLYAPNYKTIFYDPLKVKPKIAQSMEALEKAINNIYSDPGTSIISFAEYPRKLEDIEAWLELLLDWDKPLAIDIETFDLKHYKSGIGSISFAWNENEGIAFAVDYEPIPNAISPPFGKQGFNKPVRALLKSFFERYLSKAIYHNISFDVYILIYQLFMDDLTDTAGLLTGLDVMLKNWDDTKLITYLATNSCAGNKLSLKEQAQEFAGNYAEDEIEDITKIPLPQLLQYNLVDALSTWFTKNKHEPTMIADDQNDVYTSIFKPAIVDIVQMQLTGMPLHKPTVKRVAKKLQKDHDTAVSKIMNSPIIKEFTYKLHENWVIQKNKKLKVKRVTIAESKEVFNPNSDVQLRMLLNDFLGLPVIEKTKTGLSSMSGDCLKALRHHTDDPKILYLLDAFIDLGAVSIILSTFIPPMLNAPQGKDGWWYVFGNYNLGGTVSGRLSSSKINLQNLPSSGTKYAKLIKSCFCAPPGWIFSGLDFDSLEDRISALTTKDPAKLKVYTDGYDGHCLRAYAYFKDQMPDINESVSSINSIAKLYKELRQKSKDPTFALTYQGTYITLMRNCGFSKEEAKSIEQNYHDLYIVSDQWVEKKLEEASKNGYVTVAFGLRVRTPLLHQVIRNNSKTPYEASAEGRTAGNALGQSWCLLNSRAASEFMGKVRKSQHKLDIRPIGQIHDAQYYLIREDLDVVQYVNHHLVKAVSWQDHPDIYHDSVKLSGKLSLFFPDWSNEITIPVNASKEEIIDAYSTSIQKLKET